ncbi:hypothetical protein [Sphingomonas fennica]|nr:hypothetical protein [Sphingomonas fennica]
MISLTLGRGGKRKYLTNEERDAALAEAAGMEERVYTLCLVCAATTTMAG